MMDDKNICWFGGGGKHVKSKARILKQKLQVLELMGRMGQGLLINVLTS